MKPTIDFNRYFNVSIDFDEYTALGNTKNAAS